MTRLHLQYDLTGPAHHFTPRSLSAGIVVPVHTCTATTRYTCQPEAASLTQQVDHCIHFLRSLYGIKQGTMSRSNMRDRLKSMGPTSARRTKPYYMSIIQTCWVIDHYYPRRHDHRYIPKRLVHLTPLVFNSTNSLKKTLAGSWALADR